MEESEGPETFLVETGEIKGLDVHSRDEAMEILHGLTPYCITL